METNNRNRFSLICGIPKDWTEVTLDEVALFRNGKAHEKVISADGGYIVVNSKFISSDGSAQKYTDEFMEPLFENEIVMVMSDVPNGKAIAKCFYIDQNNLYTLNQRICALTSKKINPRYLYYSLNRNQYFLKFDDGVNQTNLRKNEVVSCPLRVPPIYEQQRIADILTTVDEHISEIQSLIEKTKVLKQGMIQQLLTKGIGHSEFKDTDIGWIPTAWEVMPLGNVTEILIGGTPSRNMPVYWDIDKSTNNVWVSIKDLSHSGKYIKDSSERISDQGVIKSNCKLIKKNTLLMSFKLSIGKVAISECDLYTNEAIAAFYHTKAVTTEFLYYMLPTLKYETDAAIKGHTLNKEKLKITLCPTPPINEQKQIVQILTSADAYIDIFKSKYDNFHKLRTSLMQQLLSGKIRVNA